MPVPDIDTVLAWRGRTIVDRSGKKIGRFEDIYLDTRSDLPEWAAVSMGLLARRQGLVPLSEATEAGDDLQVPFDKEEVESAPDVDADGELSQEEEAALYRHYGMDYSKEESPTGLPADAARSETSATADRDTARADRDTARVDRDTGSADRDAAPAAMTRSEEEVVDVRGGEMRPRERVRLKKYVVTEPVTKTVPVQREEIRVEREPLEPEDARAEGVDRPEERQ